MDYQEYLKIREKKKQKAREKSFYKKILQTKIAPAVILCLILGLGVMYFRPERVPVQETASVHIFPLYLEMSRLCDPVNGQDSENVEEKTTLLLMMGRDSEEAQETDDGNGAFPDVFLVDGISGPTCVNIRSGAGITADILGKLYVGAGGTVEKYDSEWCYITSGSVSGYVCTDYILTGDDLEHEMLMEGSLFVVPGVDDASVYERMDSDSECLGTLSLEAQVISVSKYYIGISYEGRLGYVLRSRVSEVFPDYINAVSIEEEEESKSISASIAESEREEAASSRAAEFDALFTKTDDVVYATENVNVRASYGEDAEIIGYMFIGDSAARTAKGKNGWDQIDYYGMTAYVCNQYLSTKDPLETVTTPATTKAPAETVKSTTKAQNQTTKSKETTASEKQTTPYSSTGQKTSLTEDEILMLAAMIYCEAGGESSEVRLAVANVILNRLHSGHWGSTLESVLSARGQFSPYASGRYAKVLAAGPNSECIASAKAAMSGKLAVPESYMFFCSASAFSYRYSNYMKLGSVIFYGK